MLFGEFGARPNHFPSIDDPNTIFARMLEEFEYLPKIITSASDYVAAFCIESILKLLKARDWADLAKFRSDGPSFLEACSVSSLRASEDVEFMKSIVNKF